MDKDTLIDEVTQRTDMSSTDNAETAIGATLRVFGERIGTGTSEAIAEHLPETFVGYLRMDTTEAASFSVEEFYERVNEYEREDEFDVDEQATQDHIRAVFASLATDPAVERELRPAMEQLPTSYETLFSSVDWEAQSGEST